MEIVPSKDQIEIINSAIEYCDDNDKSTEFMIQYIQDVSGLDHDTVLGFLIENYFD